ncbi:hypothetical protein AAIR98_001680 [Elusimicrobium simillimum]|uniref:hypothetical protein n=1 Tax=Elusimicrobium simillimum TaxID=3143438 RepID=UPI003C701825
MKRSILLLALVAFIFACGGSSTDVTRRSGIDYSQYAGVPTTDTDYQGSEEEDFVGESRYSSQAAYGDAVVTVASKKIPLGRKASEAHMKVFMQSLDKAYIDAKRAYNPVGFTYAMSLAGTINPFSDMEVQCMLSQESADDIGQVACDLFFKSLRSEYALAIEEAKL